jgi:hypothetical protein
VKYGSACIAGGRNQREIRRGRNAMKNRHVDTVGQEDREFEELLCLAYLFTHSVYAESPDDYEIPPVDYGELFQNHFCN